MYVQNVDNVYDLNFNGKPAGKGRVSYGDVFLQAEQEYSRYNFEEADTAILLKRFEDCENECKALLARNVAEGKPTLSLPAYDQCIKASHTFNLLDARGVISVTERQAYILRVRELAKACCEAWSHTATGGAAA
jgi:glycyl-tRNA synthetase alpha chain